ncbi:hypothetical protein QY885_05320 [Latilactobacillus sakei]
MITYFEIQTTGEIRESRSEKAANWIHFEDPSKHEMRAFCAEVPFATHVV